MIRSQRHHYIPRFLINKFTDEDGLVWIYNKEYKSFSHKGTNAVFFEMNRNTTFVNDQPTDNLEQLYAAIDNEFAKLLDDLLNRRELTIEDVTNILILANTLKWRIPLNDKEFESYKDTLKYEDLPIKIYIKGENAEVEKDAKDCLLNSELFNASKRIIFPMLPFYVGENLNEEQLLPLVQKSYINANDKINTILGDMPFIEKGDLDIWRFNEMIFPLSKTHTFIYSESGLGGITNDSFYLLRDLITFHQAERYVVCSNKGYLEQVIKQYNHARTTGLDNFFGDRIFEIV